MAAHEIVCEPYLVNKLRDRYRSHVKLSTYPTEVGKSEIDPFHAYYGLHVIRGKPLSAFSVFDEPRLPPRQASDRRCV